MVFGEPTYQVIYNQKQLDQGSRMKLFLYNILPWYQKKHCYIWCFIFHFVDYSNFAHQCGKKSELCHMEKTKKPKRGRDWPIFKCTVCIQCNFCIRYSKVIVPSSADWKIIFHIKINLFGKLSWSLSWKLQSGNI